MKKITKILLIAITFMSFSTINVKAIESSEIDFEGQIITYNEQTNEFNVNYSNFQASYQWIKLADDGSALINAYNEYQDALIQYQSNSSDTTLEEAKNSAKSNLESLLSIASIDESAWQETDVYYGDVYPGDKFVKWIKVINNEDSSVLYGFGIYATENSNEVVEEPTNPDTGISPLYTVPVLLILGSTLIFKKRRYE